MRLKTDAFFSALKFGIALVLIGVVVSEVNPETLLSLVNRISFSWFFLSVLAFYAVIWFMATRYWILLEKEVAFNDVLRIVFYQTSLGSLLTPAAGVGFYIATLRTKYNVQISQGLTSLVLARFGDLLVLVILLTIATAVVWPDVPGLHLPLTYALLCILLIGTGASLILRSRLRLVTITEHILRIFRLHEKRLGQRMLNWVTILANQNASRTGTGSFLYYSVLTLWTMVIFAYFSLKIFGVSIGIWPVIFVVCITQLIGVIPIQVFGGLGINDLTYLYLYGLFGLDRGEFAAVIIGLRLSFYLTNLLLFPIMAITTRSSFKI